MNAEVTTAYEPDILGPGFEKKIIRWEDDYEGAVVSTLIRKQCDTPKQTAVLYVHGFNDYFFQEEMAREYNLHGYDFYAVDLRKYGRSLLVHQKLNNVRDLAEYDADLDWALSTIRKEGHFHVLLSGHSTGGLIVSLYADKRKGNELFDAVFLNSPFWDMNLNVLLKKLAIPLLACWGKHYPNQEVDGGFSALYGLSLHKSHYGEWDYRLDWKPDVAPKVNCGWIRAIHLGQRKVKEGLRISRPVLVIHAAQSVYLKKWSAQMFSGDAVLNVKDMERLVKRLKGEVKVFVAQGAIHDVVLSPKPVRAVVYQELFLWLNKVMAKFTIS
ncbi:alpha/beta hydrolase [Pedobacter nutrimenti]|uniref:Alpha-beta hydrolase superfamily lysophospholipase n=1 Tax=Pedobacter nutrimenti TaxID=1241337 RepID=A0A318URK2_9SPHI|nr:alpha/beta hydrolase [Pedobacter nutrimenti]PYF76715.1 alpha-beta hydrolase superfamily lysophospholipase [Pedobacter nutrimenti]